MPLPMRYINPLDTSNVWYKIPKSFVHYPVRHSNMARFSRQSWIKCFCFTILAVMLSAG